MTIASLLGVNDLVAIVVIAAVIAYALYQHRSFKVNVGAFQATINEVRTEVVHAAVEASEAKASAASTADAVGVKNGEGDLMTMVARSLGELAQIRTEQEAVKAQLDERTHITRAGASTSEELGPYMQWWFHELNTQLTVFLGLLHVLWSKLQDDYDLPDLPSIKGPLK